MKIPRRALVLLLWPTFCGLVVGGGLGLITGSLSAGLLFAVIAAAVSLLILNGWEMESIQESELHRELACEPYFSHVPGHVAQLDRGSHCFGFDENPFALSNQRNFDPALSFEPSNVFYTSDQDVHCSKVDDGRTHF